MVYIIHTPWILRRNKPINNVKHSFSSTDSPKSLKEQENFQLFFKCLLKTLIRFLPNTNTSFSEYGFY